MRGEVRRVRLFLVFGLLVDRRGHCSGDFCGELVCAPAGLPDLSRGRGSQALIWFKTDLAEKIFRRP